MLSLLSSFLSSFSRNSGSYGHPKGLKPAVREAESIVLVVVEAGVGSLEEDWKPDVPDEDAVLPAPVEDELA